ncbi:MAG: ribonuclease catalytic domain-containing protein [Desulfococcaceae bacterium]
MEPGNIVEYIDRQKIVSAAVYEVRNQRVRLLNEHNREANLAVSRLTHASSLKIDIVRNREKVVEALQERSRRRRELSREVDVRELWDILHSEKEWIDLKTMTELCFPDNPTEDHESAVARAFFEDRLYFKFNNDSFFPYTENQVEQIRARAREAARKQRLIDTCGDWLKTVLDPEGNSAVSTDLTPEQQECVRILKSYYLFEKESPHHELGKAILQRSGTADIESLFRFLVKLKVWDPNENIDLYRYQVPTDFPKEVLACTDTLVRSGSPALNQGRRDLTDFQMITIDGQATLDFDDALSIQEKEDHYLLGVHIADVGQFIEKGSLLDREAIHRGSSIYMPDQKIPMLPPSLAEGRCSLRAGELRPAISTLIKLNLAGDIVGYDVFPSTIRVTDQLTYYDVNMVADESREIFILHQIAQRFRQKRLAGGAVQITLPEINIWIDENGDLQVTKTNRESPGRLLVSEIMIMANWLMAKFLQSNDLPAVFRSQPSPRERLYKENGGTLFQNWMQRKYLSRFVLSPEPEPHSGLGLDAYLTATSPIRKYFDLITQRQIRAAFDLDTPYSKGEIKETIQLLIQPMSHVSRLQNRRKRYWLLKYLEGRVGRKEEAIVLSRRRNCYIALMTDYMIECPIPLSAGVNLKPEDVIQVTIQHVNARKDVLSVFMG